MSMVTEEIRSKATELYHGDEVCQEKAQKLLGELGLPTGLLPLQDIEECGYVQETGFVWLKQKKEIKHKFEKIGRLVSYAPEVTAYVEPCKIKKLTGVKSKELLLWITISEITIDQPQAEKIVFKIASGLYRVFPASAFEIQEEKEKKKEKDETKKEGQETVVVKEV